MPVDSTPVDLLPLENLAQRCAMETARFLRNEAYDDVFGRELFRRAFVLMDNPAWEVVYVQYRGMVANWIRNHTRFVQCSEAEEAFVHDAFLRMMNAFRNQPGKFANMASLARLLAYLKLCCHSAIMAHLEKRRGESVAGMALDDERIDSDRVGLGRLAPNGSDSGETDGDADAGTLRQDRRFPSPHQQLMGHLWRTELWHLIQARLRTEKEIVVVHCMFIGEQKLQSVYHEYGHLFATPQEISRVKYNLLERLRRDPALQRFWAEHGRSWEAHDHE